MNFTSNSANSDFKDQPSLRGKVAVVTGAASGIGLAIAIEAAKRGMDVALADLGEERLNQARKAVEGFGVRAIAVKTDVSRLDSVQRLHSAAAKELGTPWLVANNAGITKVALTWDHTESDWRRMFDINVGGVINGVLTFLPGLLERNEGHIVNTASAAGLVTIPASAAYVASKHAVVGLSETLYRDLTASRSHVGVSVLCPALVKTNILGTSAHAAGESALNSPHALDPSDVAREVVEAVLARRFWILTHAEHMRPYMLARVAQMLSQSNPDALSVDPDAAALASRLTGVSFR